MDKKRLQVLHSHFDRNLAKMYRSIKPSKRKQILPYLNAIYRRWYYSALLPNVRLSPAHIMTICTSQNSEPMRNLVVRMKNPVRMSGTYAKPLIYSADKHPVVADLKRVVEFCKPQINLHESACFTDGQSAEISAALSIKDPHYTGFILEIVLQMKLLSKRPSLHVYCVEVSPKYDELLQLTNEEIFQKIVEVSIKLSSSGLRFTTPLPESIFTVSFIRSLLKEPISTDEIFERIFNTVGYDYGELAMTQTLEISDDLTLEDMGYDMQMITATMMLGVLLDRYFFTIFGQYLRIITPFYQRPFDFKEEIDFLVDNETESIGAFVAFFAPCSSYTLTDLGLEVMGAKKNAANYYTISEKFKIDIIDTVLHGEEEFNTAIELANQLASSDELSEDEPLEETEQLGFLVARREAESEPIIVKLPESFPLYCLYEMIAEVFELRENDNFSFFKGKTENSFEEIPSSKRAERAKKPRQSADMPICELDFDKHKDFLLVVYDQALLLSNEPNIVRFDIKLQPHTYYNPHPL